MQGQTYVKSLGGFLNVKMVYLRWMEYFKLFGQFPLLTTILLSNIKALENGMERGYVFCNEGLHGTLVRVEKGDFGFVASVGYPNNYTAKTQEEFLCNVEIQACNTCRIRLTLINMIFPKCDPNSTVKFSRFRSVCVPGCDHLRIFEVDQPYHSATEQNYFTSDEGFVYNSISSRLVILHCKSNSTNSLGKMFKVKFEVIDKVQRIQGTVTSPMYSVISGSITSPNFPNGYALNGETFTYILQNLDPYGHIRLIFDDWDIAEKSRVEVYDDLSGNSKSTVLRRGHRPILISNTNILVVVFMVGLEPYACCNNIGFKATYHFVSDDTWIEKPETDCSSSYVLKAGGTIYFSGQSSDIPTFYDCVWQIKRHIANYPDGLILRFDEVALGDGWLQSGLNSIEVRDGLTSTSHLLARYVSTNISAGNKAYTRWDGFYIRLRGIFYKSDVIKLVYTGVNNITSDGCPTDSEYLCDNLWCIDKELLCDGTDHCGDNSDENPVLVCSVQELWGVSWPNPRSEMNSRTPCSTGYECGTTGECIRLEQICDGVYNCHDETDEINCAFDFFSGQESCLVVKHLTILAVTFLHLMLCS